MDPRVEFVLWIVVSILCGLFPVALPLFANQKVSLPPQAS